MASDTFDKESMEQIATATANTAIQLNQVRLLMQEMLGDQRAITAEMKQQEESMKKQAEEREKEKKDLEKKKKFYGSAKDQGKRALSDVKGFSRSVTGMSLSLGGILALLLKATNNVNRMAGFGKQAAQQLGGADRDVKKLGRAVSGLHHTFLLTADEAGGVVNALTQMGMTAEEVSGKGFKKIQKSMKDMKSASTEEHRLNAKRAFTEADNMKRTAADRKRLFDKGNNEVRLMNKIKRGMAATETSAANKQARAQETQIGAAKELYAIQVQYGLAIQQSATAVVTLEREFAASNVEARNMLGAAIKVGQKLDNIGLTEVVSDWQTMIQQAGTYQTHVMGILALYKTMLSTEKDSFWAKGIPTSVRKDVAGTIAGWNKNLSFGLKAWLITKDEAQKGMGSSSVAARGMMFEKMTGEGRYGELFVKFAEKMKTDVAKGGGDEYTQMKKVRGMSEKFGFGKDASRYLAEFIVQGKGSNKGIQALGDKFAKEKKAVEESEKKWATQRGSLITHAADTARNIMTMEQRIRKAINRFAEKYVMPIITGINVVLSYLRLLVPGAPTKEDQAANLAKVMVDLNEKRERYIKAIMKDKGVKYNVASGMYDKAMEQAVEKVDVAKIQRAQDISRKSKSMFSSTAVGQGFTAALGAGPAGLVDKLLSVGIGDAQRTGANKNIADTLGADPRDAAGIGYSTFMDTPGVAGLDPKATSALNEARSNLQAWSAAQNLAAVLVLTDKNTQAIKGMQTKDVVHTPPKKQVNPPGKVVDEHGNN